MNIVWSIIDTEYLIKEYKLKSDFQLGQELNRSRRSIQAKREQLKLIRSIEDVNKIRSQTMMITRQKHPWSTKKRIKSTYDKRKRRLEVLQKYGGICVNCGNNDLDILEFDHVNDNGYLTTGKETYSHIENNPDLFQLLCPNCNKKKRIYYLEFKRLERLGLPPF